MNAKLTPKITFQLTSGVLIGIAAGWLIGMTVAPSVLGQRQSPQAPAVVQHTASQPAPDDTLNQVVAAPTMVSAAAVAASKPSPTTTVKPSLQPVQVSPKAVEPATSTDQGQRVDVFPDLTDTAIAQVQAYYQGSFETPEGFKGLPTDPQLAHYTCEYAQVLGDQVATQACQDAH